MVCQLFSKKIKKLISLFKLSNILNCVYHCKTGTIIIQKFTQNPILFQTEKKKKKKTGTEALPQFYVIYVLTFYCKNILKARMTILLLYIGKVVRKMIESLVTPLSQNIIIKLRPDG